MGGEFGVRSLHRLFVELMPCLQVHTASQQLQQRWVAVELRADRCDIALLSNRELGSFLLRQDLGVVVSRLHGTA